MVQRASMWIMVREFITCWPNLSGRLKRYSHYIAMPPDEKTRRLLELARQDHFYAKIINTLENYGYQVTHPLFGQNGAYFPASIQISNNIKWEDAAQHRPSIPAKFTFSARYGPAQIAHYWLHELTHFWQDIRGLFLTPLVVESKSPIMLDAPSHIAVTCLCEALAETEALRASWRLKQAGWPLAWAGALSSFDWRTQAQAYEKDIRSMPELVAARRCFDRWYQSSQRLYYERRAFRTYRTFLNDLGVKTITAENLRSVDLMELIKTLPESERPQYLVDSPNSNTNSLALNDRNYCAVQDKRTSKQVYAHQSRYGLCANSNFTDIQNGSAPYLWSVSQK